MTGDQYREGSISLGTVKLEGPTFTGVVTNVICSYCGSIHDNRVCSLVKALEYYPNGTVKRVEFKTAADYPQSTPVVMANGNL